MGRIRKAIEKYRARRRIKKRGREQPDEEMFERIRKGVFSKQAKEAKIEGTLEELSATPTASVESLFKKFILSFNQLSAEQYFERRRIATKISTKYALDAIGLSTKYDRKTREQVHSVMQDLCHNLEKLYLLTSSHVPIETVNKIIDKQTIELTNLLGTLKAKKFLKNVFPKFKEILNALEFPFKFE